ncbi:UbiA family prenyltransferase [Georgenia satyanarayanai]|uniref:UbiA family prenyltransferase n=1 Tax=Georgenia satyanarayanai TaxID=860221 RepID=UPI001D035D68|nr:UbiA family prenyltransferase [Georgenia satyanarayanai]
MPLVTALARASHPAPTVVVTALAALLAVGAGHGPAGTLLVGLAVLTGQLSIGWSNDLLDAGRDRAVGRADKPLATGALSTRVLGLALGLTVAATVALSLALGVRAALAHLLLVGGGWAYNLGLKSTVVSWLPYVVAFAALPVVPWLALDPPVLPPWWMPAVGGLLGAGAHVVNVLPDLADDAATGVRGLPHRLGARASGVLAVVILLTGTAVAVLGPHGPVPVWAWTVLAGAGILAVVSLGRPGRAPFHAAMVIALANVVVLLVRAA